MEQNLLQKKANLRAKLIGYQNQISWILCEYEKLKNVKLVDKWIKAKSVALYENLNTIVDLMNDECLFEFISSEYSRTINGVLGDLKELTESANSVSEMNVLLRGTK